MSPGKNLYKTLVVIILNKKKFLKKYNVECILWTINNNYLEIVTYLNWYDKYIISYENKLKHKNKRGIKIIIIILLSKTNNST